jgi:hypothetical protein
MTRSVPCSHHTPAESPAESPNTSRTVRSSDQENLVFIVASESWQSPRASRKPAMIAGTWPKFREKLRASTRGVTGADIEELSCLFRPSQPTFRSIRRHEAMFTHVPCGCLHRASSIAKLRSRLARGPTSSCTLSPHTISSTVHSTLAGAFLGTKASREWLMGQGGRPKAKQAFRAHRSPQESSRFLAFMIGYNRQPTNSRTIHDHDKW